MSGSGPRNRERGQPLLPVPRPAAMLAGLLAAAGRQRAWCRMTAETMRAPDETPERRMRKSLAAFLR